MSEFILCFENDKEKNENIKQKPKISINENLKNPMIKEEENLNENKLISEYNNKIKISKLQQSSKVFKERKDFGNIEYKLKLNEMTNEKLEKKITKMKFRLKEGNGECHYYIGVEDNGNPLGINEKEMNISIEIIRKIVSEIENAKIRKIEYLKGKKEENNNKFVGKNKFVTGGKIKIIEKEYSSKGNNNINEDENNAPSMLQMEHKESINKVKVRLI